MGRRGVVVVVVAELGRRCRRGTARRGTPEREDRLDEGDMSRRVHAPGLNVVAPITTMVTRVAEEHTRHGARTKLVWCRRSDVGVAKTAEYAELVVVRRRAEEKFMRRRDARGATRSAIDDVRGRVQRFGPEGVRCCTVNKQCSDTIINSS
jgi:hypothetical protein